MKGSRKGVPPQGYTDWLAEENDDWFPTYGALSREIKVQLRDSLAREQRGLCVYCGRKLNLGAPGKTYHIEHFRPQHSYPTEAVKYCNLFLSCGQKDKAGLPAPTCGNLKDRWFDENSHIIPNYPECTERFNFLISGKIEPATALDTAAVEMIKRLGLDHPELEKDRETVLFLIDDGQLDLNDFWDSMSGSAESYAHVAYQHFGIRMP